MEDAYLASLVRHVEGGGDPPDATYGPPETQGL